MPLKSVGFCNPTGETDHVVKKNCEYETRKFSRPPAYNLCSAIKKKVIFKVHGDLRICYAAWPGSV